mmetsp:Transcript_24918/g.62954  ORF Transcript_24918/g.62954 Transcript_24918/m.62954 type:complete len:205 (-) Transcript_24918:17-631(-)
MASNFASRAVLSTRVDNFCFTWPQPFAKLSPKRSSVLEFSHLRAAASCRSVSWKPTLASSSFSSASSWARSAPECWTSLKRSCISCDVSAWISEICVRKLRTCSPRTSAISPRKAARARSTPWISSATRAWTSVNSWACKRSKSCCVWQWHSCTCRRISCAKAFSVSFSCNTGGCNSPIDERRRGAHVADATVPCTPSSDSCRE